MARWCCTTQAPITCAASSCGTVSERRRWSESEPTTRSTQNTPTVVSRPYRGSQRYFSTLLKVAASRHLVSRRAIACNSSSIPPGGRTCRAYGSMLRGQPPKRRCAREPHPGQRRQRVHWLGTSQSAGQSGHRVRVLDDNSRGSPRRLTEVANDIEF